MKKLPGKRNSEKNENEKNSSYTKIKGKWIWSYKVFFLGTTKKISTEKKKVIQQKKIKDKAEKQEGMKKVNAGKRERNGYIREIE